MDISSDIDMYEKVFINRNETFQIEISNANREFPTLSKINTKKTNTITQLTTVDKINKALISKKIAYPNKEEIQLIKIKNENLLESGEEIVKYIKNLSIFDDSKFNNCNICKKLYNNYFCEDCHKNICDICHKNCMEKNHKLINLIEELDKINEYITNIRLLFAENLILPKKSKDNDEKIKEFKNNSFSDEYEMNNTFAEKQSMMDYSYDIILIEYIIEKNYINYFHYKNVEECFNYIVKKYPIISINRSLNLQNDSKNDSIDIKEDSDGNNDYIIIRYKLINKKKKIKIFGKRFLNKYKNICNILYKNKKFELTEHFKPEKIKGNNIFEIKLTGVIILYFIIYF